MNAQDPKTLKGAGAGFLGVGIAFFVIATTGDQPIFVGVGCAFIALGVVFLGKARQDR
jgi:hypothetical protein